MIPKIIHYIWFGGNPLPELAVKCIESWKKYCPDYEIMIWDERNFDVSVCAYTKEAYDAKKWAFVSDYVRLKALYEYGGIYMDTDVELVKSLDGFLHEKAFSGFETKESIPTGIMASEKGHHVFGEMLDYYKGKHFIKENGEFDQTTNVTIITNIMKGKGIKLDNRKQTICDMTFYPKEFFCPKDPDTGILHATADTVCIHHFDGSWHSDREKKLMRAVQFCNKHLGGFNSTGIRVYKLCFMPELVLKKAQKVFTHK